MVCLKPAHSLAREGLDEVNDAIPCGMGNERMSAGLDDKAHRLDGIGIHDVDVARRCWPEQLGKRLVRVRDASTFDEQPREKRTIGGLPRRAQVIGTHGAPTVAKQIGHSEGTFGAPSAVFVEILDKCRITPVDEIAEHVHGTPVVPGRYLDAGDELDAVFGTCRDGGRQAGEGIVIGERDDGQSVGLDCHLRYAGRFAGAVRRG